jgi:putative transposase
MKRKSRAKLPSPFRCFNSSPEVIRLVVLMYVRFPLSLRNVEDMLFECGTCQTNVAARAGGC